MKPSTYIDYLKIYCPTKTRTQLEESLPLSLWRSYADRIDLAHNQHNKRSYESSTLLIIRPTNKLIQMVAAKEHLLGAYYISYLEISLDIPAPSEAAAERMLKRIAKTMTRRYVSEHKLFQASDLKYEKREFPDQPERLFSDNTYYWGLRNKAMHLALYAAYSKAYLPELRPAVHLEWRIKHASNIRMKTGVDELRDLLALDLKSTFSSLLQASMRFNKINHEKHGRFLLNAKHKVKIDPQKAVRASEDFCSEQGINSFAQLRDFYNQERKKISRKIGNWSSWERTVVDMSSYHLKTFADEVDAPKILDSIIYNITI
jgi:hypothetical protein